MRATLMPAASAASGNSPQERSPKTEGGALDDEPADDQNHQHEPSGRVGVGQKELADHGDVLEHRNVHAGHAVDDDVAGADEPPRDVEHKRASHQVDGRSADRLVGVEVDAREGVQHRKEGARQHREQDAQPGGARVAHQRPEVVDRNAADEGSDDHQPLEADVDDAAALGEEAAQRRDEDGDGIAHRVGGHLFNGVPHVPRSLPIWTGVCARRIF